MFTTEDHIYKVIWKSWCSLQYQYLYVFYLSKLSFFSKNIKWSTGPYEHIHKYRLSKIVLICDETTTPKNQCFQKIRRSMIHIYIMSQNPNVCNFIYILWLIAILFAILYTFLYQFYIKFIYEFILIPHSYRLCRVIWYIYICS